MFDNIIMDASATNPDDLSLVTAATNALRLLSRTDKPFSYCTRLHKNFAWCTEIATLIHNLRKPVISDATKSGGNFFEQNTFDTSSFTQKEAPEHLPVIAPKPTHGYGSDLPMDTDLHQAKSGPSSDSWNSIASDLNLNDLSFFQSTDILNNNEPALRTDNLTDVFTQPGEMTPVDALKWMFDKGNGLESSF